MIRDLSTAIGLFLQGRTVEESLDVKFDYQDKFALDGWSDFTEQGYTIFPSSNQSHFVEVTGRIPNDVQQAFDFQIKYLRFLKKDEYYLDYYLTKVIEDKIDYLFWNFGFHELSSWVVEGENPVLTFYADFHGIFRDYYYSFNCPAVWVSMNSNCQIKKKIQYQKDVMPVNKLNMELGEILKVEHWPYYDATMVLRSPELCTVSDDGMQSLPNVSFHTYYCKDSILSPL